MFIRNGKRFNIYPKFTDPTTGEKGIDLTRPENQVRYGIKEISDPVRESDETHYNQEIADAPYLISTQKPAEHLRSILWDKIKNIRDNIIENGGCFVSNKWFHSDARSKQQQIVLMMLGANLPQDIQWKTMDGTFITLTPSIVTELFSTQIARELSVFSIGEVKRTDINSASFSQLVLYDVTLGWPTSYDVGVIPSAFAQQ